LNGSKAWEPPEVINTGKAMAYAAAIAALKAEGKCPRETLHRQVKYLNNMIESDHGKLKPLPATYATIKGLDVMRVDRLVPNLIEAVRPVFSTPSTSSSASISAA
jgi:transposase-like protein